MLATYGLIENFLCSCAKFKVRKTESSEDLDKIYNASLDVFLFYILLCRKCAIIFFDAFMYVL